MAGEYPLLPKKMFLTKGIGKHKEKLSSFELALRNAGIEKFNIVRVSSIFPPGCKVISKQKGFEQLSPGQILFCVIAENASNEPNRLMAASIGVAIPNNLEHYGYLSEHDSFGQTEKVAGEYAEDLAAEMLASTYGIQFDIDASWDAKKDIFKIDGRIVKTRNITQSAICGKTGLWTTVISAAVFIM
ncbi:MAG: arginine decarboxylase, pyruvoyl-dependent [Thermoplasmata archaeon]|nr:arginine decarboxylase, pyruvoyl-dependent [Thermoplasmata archaeon]